MALPAFVKEPSRILHGSKNMPERPTTVGVLGGGQLGRMLAEAANRLDIKTVFLDAAKAPGKQITAHDDHIEGSFSDEASVKRLAEACDILTIEIEHVNAAALEDLPSSVKVEPAPPTIRLIQNKYQQKLHLQKHDIAVAPFVEVTEASQQGLEQVFQIYKEGYMLKSQTQAYDGRGNASVRNTDDITSALKALKDRPLYAEQWCNFTKELAVVVVKTKDGVLSYPTVETVHEDSICKLVFAPPRGVPSTVSDRAQKLARDAIATFPGKGVFAVEMFMVGEGNDAELLVNEIAPRVHNSGHLTMEACPISQFEAHLRAILDLPISQEDLILERPAIMLNILGGAQPDSHLRIRDEAYKIPRARVHLYGKGDARPGRKMGHVTVTGKDISSAYKTIYPLIETVDKVRASRTDVPKSSAPRADAPRSAPQVLVCMGSNTDLPAVEPALEILRKCKIRYEAHVSSAHRTPDFMIQLSKEAASRGIKVIIAAAGGSAHLPGMLSAYTPLHVIAIPVKGSTFDGIDSVYSSLQMPNGTPVGLQGVGRGANAGLAAAEIIGAFDEDVQRARWQLKKEAAAKSMEADRKLAEEETKKQNDLFGP